MSCDREDQRRKTDEHKRICEHISVCNHRAPPLQEVDNLAVLTGRRIIAQSAALCQFAALRGGFFLLVQLREFFRDVLGDGAGRHLDAVAVRVVSDLVAGGDIDLRAGAGKVARHDGLHDAVLNTRVFAQARGGIGDFNGLAVGCDSLVSSHCVSPFHFVYYVPRHVMRVSYNFAALVQIISRVGFWRAGKRAAGACEHISQCTTSYVLNIFGKRNPIRSGIIIALRLG